MVYDMGQMQWIWLFEYDFLFLAIGFGCIAFIAGRHPATQNVVTRRMRILLWTVVVFSGLKVCVFLFFSTGTFVISSILSGITGIILIPPVAVPRNTCVQRKRRVAQLRLGCSLPPNAPRSHDRTFLIWLGCALGRLTTNELTDALFPTSAGSGGYGTSHPVSALTSL